jgi:hypothetical protein
MASIFTARLWSPIQHKYIVLAGEEKVFSERSVSTPLGPHYKSKSKQKLTWPIMLGAAIVLTALIVSRYERMMSLLLASLADQDP